jgi:hypothetical protein
MKFKILPFRQVVGVRYVSRRSLTCGYEKSALAGYQRMMVWLRIPQVAGL